MVLAAAGSSSASVVEDQSGEAGLGGVALNLRRG